MNEKYNFAEVEKKWQKEWAESNIYKVTEDENKSEAKRS